MTKTYYICILLLAITADILMDTGTLERGWIDDSDASVSYVCNLVSIAVTFVGCFTALRLFRFKGVAAQVAAPETGAKAHVRWTNVRTTILAIMLLTDLVLCHGCLYSTTPQYCLGVALVTATYCWPTRYAEATKA